MMRNEDGEVYPCELKAGGKHQNNPEFRRHCQQWLMEYSRDHGFTVEDNLKIEDQRKQERYGQRNQELAEAIREAAKTAPSYPALVQALEQASEAMTSLSGNDCNLLGNPTISQCKKAGENSPAFYCLCEINSFLIAAMAVINSSLLFLQAP